MSAGTWRRRWATSRGAGGPATQARSAPTGRKRDEIPWENPLRQVENGGHCTRFADGEHEPQARGTRPVAVVTIGALLPLVLLPLGAPSPSSRCGCLPVWSVRAQLGASTRCWPLSWSEAPLAQSSRPSVPVCQERELSLPLRTPSVNYGVYKYPTFLPLALEPAACLASRCHAKVSGIPSSHAKYPLGSGALALRGYFA